MIPEPERGEGDDALESVLESFLQQLRQGARPSIEDVVARHPGLAIQIRELLPAVLEIEGVGPSGEGPSTPGARSAARSGRLAFDRMGDYRVVRYVGEGGMGSVYEAVRESLSSRVALKVMHERYRADSTYLHRFRLEARAAAGLHHTNIVSVFDFGEHEGVCYYAMQFIQGQGLDRVLDDVRRLQESASPPAPVPTSCPGPECIALGMLTGRFSPSTLAGSDADGPGATGRGTGQERATEVAPPDPQRGAGPDDPGPGGSGGSGSLSGPNESRYYREVARLGAQVADALSYAHKRGVLHRDIKPSNILLDPTGNAWITDFGLAKFEDGEDLTRSRDLVGTLRYLAPERFRGVSDRRGDVYSLGVTLYEMLGLRPAFPGTDQLHLVRRIGHETPPPLRQIDRRIPRDLETIVSKAMARDPRDRFADAGEMAEELRRFVDGRPIDSRPIRPPERLWRWCRRNPVVAALNALAVLLAVTTAAVSTVAASNNRRLAGQLRLQRDAAEAAEKKARLREADALVGEAHAIRLTRREGQRFASLAALEKAAAIGRELRQSRDWFDRLRNEAVAALARPDLFVTQQWAGEPEGTSFVAPAADLSLYVRGDSQGTLSVCRTGDAAALYQIPGDGRVSEGHLSPDGRYLLRLRHDRQGGNREATLFRTSGAGATEVTRTGGVITGIFWSHPEGTRVIFATETGRLSLHDASDGRLLASFEPGEVGTQPRLHPHPTAPFVALSSYFHRLVEVRDLRSGRFVARLASPWPGGCTAAWHPSGRYLLIGAGDQGATRVYSFDQGTGGLEYRWSVDCSHGETKFLFNRRGDRIYATGWDALVSLSDFWTGQKLFQTSNPSVLPLALDSATGRLALSRVAERPAYLGVWSVAEGREYRRITATSDLGKRGAYTAALHPLGRLVAQGTKDAVVLFELATGESLGSIPFPAMEEQVYTAFDAPGRLYTNGFHGAFRWPVRADTKASRRLVIGPPEPLPLYPGDRQIAASRDGRVVAQSMFRGYGMEEHCGGWVLHPDHPLPRVVGAAASMGSSQVSPDGRWVVFGSSDGVLVCDAAAATVVRRLPHADHSFFSADGRLLFTGGLSSRAHATGSWETIRELGPGEVCDATGEGEYAILRLPAGFYRLVHVPTGRELVRLEDPDYLSLDLHFSPDGTKLVANASDGVRVWDLRRIRAELTRLGLDWDAPPFPREADRPGDDEHLEVELVGADRVRDPLAVARGEVDRLSRRREEEPRDGGSLSLLGYYLALLGRHEEALTAYSQAIAAGADSPTVRSRRAEEALSLGRFDDAIMDTNHVLATEPLHGTALPLRAHAYRLAGRYAEAISDYTTIIERFQRFAEPYDLKADCYDALGDRSRAEADRLKAREIDPGDAGTLSALAQRLLRQPTDRHLLARALRLAVRAVEKEPRDEECLNALGVAQYRNGKYAEAVATLNQSLAVGRTDYEGANLYFLAMCHARLGDGRRSKELVDQATTWVAARALSPTQAFDLAALRAEAEALWRLGR